MSTRLVLGCGTVGHEIVTDLAGRRDELRVVVREEGWMEGLRAEDVAATVGDPADPATYPADADLIVIASDDPAKNRAAAVAAREQFPDAYLIVYVGQGADAEFREEMAAVADETIDPTTALVDRVLEVATGETAERLPRLFALLRGMAGPLAVVTHDNPDPDAIASAMALVRIAERLGLDADACHFGEISHQENRALVNLLDVDLRNLTEPTTIQEYGAVALVDHSRPGVNDGLPTETAVDIVVDHHPPRGPIEARYVDLRSEVGATSTILTDYYRRLAAGPDERTATALLYGIRTDTKDLTREATEADFEAAAALVPLADAGVLERVESPSLSPEVLDVLSAAIRNREVRSSVLVSCVGRIADRDALAQAAERLLDMEDVEVTLVYGFTGETIHVSGRVRGAEIDLGEVLREAYDRIGNAGGHADMAGAQIPLGILAEFDDEIADSLSDVVHEVIRDRFFRALSAAPSAPQPDRQLVYEQSSGEQSGGDD